MSLDPDFPSFRAQAHAALDAIIDHLETLREGPVWRPMPPEVRASFDAPLPQQGAPLDAVLDEFWRLILPYSNGNPHPRFLGWVHGGGTPVGMLAELLAGGLNANLGGRDHAPVEVERQLVRWARQLFGFPAEASGVMVTGTSMANFLAVLVAKTKHLGRQTRSRGLWQEAPLVAYASAATHGCVRRALEMAGLGADALRVIPVDEAHRISLGALRAQVRADREAGARPFLLVGNAGTVDIGAIDDLDALADLATEEGLFFHVDGAFGALGVCSRALAPRLAGLSRADSLACDFHKWAQVPYDAGFFLARDGEAHRATFASELAYLSREPRGLAAGEVWPTDLGPDLSRGFRALKVWFTLKTYGTERLGAVMDETCRLARALAARVSQEPALELLAPVPLNIVCFRVRHPEAERVNREIVITLQEQGLAAPSTTRLHGQLAIRVAIVNHRCTEADLHLIVDAILALAARL